MKKIILILGLAFLFVGCNKSTGSIDPIPPTYEKPKVEKVELSFANRVYRFKISQICDQILDKQTQESNIEICYLYNKKSAKYVSYSLDAAYIDLNNITKRPDFQSDEEIPEEYRTSYSDYTNSNYDRGHMAPDADFDYDKVDLEKTYLLTNIVLQDRTVNQEQWVDAENRERKLTREYGFVNVLNIINFSNNFYNGIGIPNGFYKVIWNNEVQECYFYLNFTDKNPSEDRLEDHLIDCNEIF